MNFLRLCQELQGIVKAVNAPVFTSPSTVVDQTNKEAEIVNFVRRAHNNLQNEQPDWKFMVKQGTFVTTAADPEYTLANIVAAAGLSTFEHFIPFNYSGTAPHMLAYRTSVGVSDSQPVFFCQYEFFRGDYDRIAVTDSRPQLFTLLPDGTLRLYPAPDVAYTLRFDFKRSALDLDPAVATPDVLEPLLPVRHHWAIVHEAIKLYALGTEGAGNLLKLYENERMSHLNRLRSDQIPDDRFDYTMFYGG